MSTIELRDAANKRKDESGSQMHGSMMSSFKAQSYGEAASKAAAINHLMSSNS